MSITEFTDSILFPRVFEVMDTVLPEFKFKNRGGNWESGNTLRLTGANGHSTGSVYVYRDRPYFVQDFSSGGKALTTYLQETGKASSWIEAIRYLSDKVGLSLPERDLSPEIREQYKAAAQRTETLEAVNDFFLEALNATDDHDARAHRDYLETRGYGEILAKPGGELALGGSRMELGLIPSQAELRDYLRGKGFSPDEIALNGAIGVSNKLTIPFRDPVGRILGFAFRNISWSETADAGKYLYSTGLKRSSLLFNLRAIKGDRDLIVVEGLLDALCAKALGLDNVIALGGTSLNETQIKAAKISGAKKITLCLDQDSPGQEATKKAIEAIRKSGEELQIYVSTLPQGFKDPDELIRNKGLDAFREVVKTAKAHYLYLLDKRFDVTDQIKLRTGELDDKDRDLLLEDVITIGSQATGPIERDLFTQAFSTRGESLGVTKGSLEAAVERLQYSKEKEKQGERLRETIAKANDLANSGREGEAQELLSNLSKQVNTGQVETSYHALIKPITEAEVRERLKQKPEAISSGLKIEEEDLLIPSGAISILAAPTSHGKTSFLINLALNMAQDKQNKPIYLFSYEESREAVLLKALNTYSGTDLSKNNRRSIESYFKGKVDYIWEKDREAFNGIKDRFFSELVDTGRLNIHYVDYTVEELVGAIRYLHKHAQVGAVLIDYMQLLRLQNNRTNSRQEELKQVCLDLKNCAVDTGLPIVLGAQFNRTVTSISAMHATAIGEAGDIERIANLIIGFWNKEFPELDSKNPLDKSPEIYATVLKGRDMGAGAKEIFSFAGNTGKINNKSKKVSVF